MLNNVNNKWINGALPALFIHCCIGSVYCWSLLKGEIASYIGTDVSNIEFAFTLAIFCLGMSAAFGGRFVELNVRKSSIVSLICFTSGLLLSCLSIYAKSIGMLFLSYGIIMGIGLGIGYLSPVKTLMLWFKDNKGLATGIAIMGFGLSKMLFSPYIQWCNNNYGVIYTLLSMATISFIFMGIACYCIKKPNGWVEEKDNFSLKNALKIIMNINYIKIWTIFFINITCGLIVISFEKNIALYSGVDIINVAFVSSMSAFFNAFGRLGYSTLSDYIKDKEIIYNIIFMTGIISCACFAFMNISVLNLVVLLIFVNLGYGGGFSTLPILLGNKFGMKNISTIHGFALSAWAFGAVAAFIITQGLVYYMNVTYNELVIYLCLLYFIAFLISLKIEKNVD